MFCPCTLNTRPYSPPAKLSRSLCHALPKVSGCTLPHMEYLWIALAVCAGLTLAIVSFKRPKAAATPQEQTMKEKERPLGGERAGTRYESMTDDV